MALAIDPSTPAVAVQTSNVTTTVTSASFTPPNGALVLVGWAWNTGSGVSPGAPSIANSGSALSWSLLGHRARPETAADGQAAMWWAVSAGAAMTVTVTAGASGLNAGAAYFWVLTGQKLSGPIGASGESGANTATTSIAQTYTAQGTGSRGFIAVADWALAGAKTAGTGMTVSASGNAGSEISYGFLRRTNADGVNGVSNSLNVTTPSSNSLMWVYAEVLEEPASDAGILWAPTLLTPFSGGWPFFTGQTPPPWQGIAPDNPPAAPLLSTLTPVGVVTYGAGTKRGSVASTATTAVSTHGTPVHVAQPSTVTSVAAQSHAGARKTRSLATVAPVAVFGRGASVKTGRSTTATPVALTSSSVGRKVVSLSSVTTLAVFSRATLDSTPIANTGTVSTVGTNGYGTVQTIRSRSTLAPVAAFSRGVSRSIRSRATATPVAAFSRGTVTRRALAVAVTPVLVWSRGSLSGRHGTGTRTPVVVLAISVATGQHRAGTATSLCVATFGSVLLEELGRIGVLRGQTRRLGNVAVTTELIGDVDEL